MRGLEPVELVGLPLPHAWPRVAVDRRDDTEALRLNARQLVAYLEWRVKKSGSAPALRRRKKCVQAGAARSSPGKEDDMADGKLLPGKFVWFEHASRDPKRAQAFYAEVLGWKVQAFPMGASTYDMIFAGDVMLGGY